MRPTEAADVRDGTGAERSGDPDRAAAPVAAAAARSRGAGLAERATGVALGLAGIGVVVAAWAVLAAVLDSSSLSSPVQVARQLPHLLADPTFRGQSWDTVWTWLVSLVVTIVVVVPVGLLVGCVAWLNRPVSLAVNALRSIPSTAMIPIAILLFGLGQEMKLAVTLYAVAWPVLINTIYGVAGTDPMRVDTARMLHWNRRTRLWHVVLPSALPSVATGLRVASGIALIVVVSTELLGASSGIGTLILSYQMADRMDQAYAAIIVTGTFGFALYGLFAAVDARLTRWQQVG
ncbi:MAG: ABC transporter permease [Acidimicrobiia bacterium]